MTSNLLIQIEKNPTGYSNKWISHRRPEHIPTLLLVADGWDDYGAETQFDVFLYLADDSYHVGKTKVLHKSDNSGDGTYYCVKHLLNDTYPDDLTDCCSLGQDVSYYTNFMRFLPIEFMGLLDRLHDCGACPKYQEEFDGHKFYYSLKRDDSAERMLREAMYVVNGTDPVTNYTFEYSFKPKYAVGPCIIRFSFERDKNLPVPRRIFALIGKNGVGKTQMITRLPLDLQEKDKVKFGGKVPIFSKILAASTCYYDNFKSPADDGKTNYLYCGLSKQVGKLRQTLTQKEMHTNLITALGNISKRGRREDYEKRIVDLLGHNVTSQALVSVYEIEKDDEGKDKIVLNVKKALTLFDRLSSGERILVYLWSQLVANIRFDTLLLFDEPETHLHPNAISELMVHLNSLLKQYDSYAIIVTHSPLVVRELKSECVLVMERIENTLLTRPVGLETFGSNLSILVDDIFGNNVSVKLFETLIKRLVRKGKSASEIESMIQSEGIPLSIRLKMMIRTLCYIRDHEEN